MKQLLGSRPLEHYFFLLVTIVNLVPVLSVEYFLTLDGPAHLYNSNLINILLTGKSELVSQYLMFNEQPVPNWTGHLILSMFNAVLPGIAAEKIFLCLYVAGLPLAFRAFVKKISPGNCLLSYLIFPFTYSFILYLGFYNFLIGVLFMFITLTYWLRNSDRLNVLRFVILFLLITATYFSHIYAFGIMLLLMAIHTAFRTITEWMGPNGSLRPALLASLKRGIWLLGASALTLVLFYLYIKQERVVSHNYLPKEELVGYLKNLRPVISYNTDEERYTMKLVYLLSALAVIAIYIRIDSIKRPEGRNFIERLVNLARASIRPSDAWLLGVAAILVMYFKLPDSDGHAGYVSIRTAFLFFLFFAAWLATQPFPKWLAVLSIAVSLWCSYKILDHRDPALRELNSVVSELDDARELVPENSVVLTLNHHFNWLYTHASNYIGADKPVVMLENYEAPTGFFPLVWNRANLPKTLLGDQAPSQSCMKIKWESNENNPVKVIDFVLVTGDLSSRTDSCSQEVKSKLAEHYRKVHSSPNFTLYQFERK